MYQKFGSDDLAHIESSNLHETKKLGGWNFLCHKFRTLSELQEVGISGLIGSLGRKFQQGKFQQPKTKEKSLKTL